MDKFVPLITIKEEEGSQIYHDGQIHVKQEDEILVSDDEMSSSSEIKEEKTDETESSSDKLDITQEEEQEVTNGHMDAWKRFRVGFRARKKLKASGSRVLCTNWWKFGQEMSLLQPNKNNKNPALRFLLQGAKEKYARGNRREKMRLQLDDPLKKFFNSMYGTTKSLPHHLQRKIKKGLLLLVAEAEEQAKLYSRSSSLQRGLVKFPD